MPRTPPTTYDYLNLVLECIGNVTLLEARAAQAAERLDADALVEALTAMAFQVETADKSMQTALALAAATLPPADVAKFIKASEILDAAAREAVQTARRRRLGNAQHATAGGMFQ